MVDITGFESVQEMKRIPFFFFFVVSVVSLNQVK